MLEAAPLQIQTLTCMCRYLLPSRPGTLRLYIQKPCRGCGEALHGGCHCCFKQSPKGPVQHMRKLDAVPNEVGA